jgi:uncharacterized OB-fold protein
MSGSAGRSLRPSDVAPDDLDAPFWDGCRRREFLVHRCDRCGRAYWPASCCIDHGAEAMRWVPASGTGSVYTYTVAYHAYEPAMADRIPYVLAVVALDEGPFFHTDLVDCPPDAVRVGLPVEVVFDAVDEETVIPRFRPTGQQGRAT